MIRGYIETPVGQIPMVDRMLDGSDRTGTVKARLGIGRMHYMVMPGLFAVGSPDSSSPVFVTANYKMSFDALRSSLVGIDGWILVLDTMGINVWCAAGKGTFGTDELVERLESTRLKDLVSHREIILPQLGAPGVAAHQVRSRSGFKVIYGPVRAEDIGAFMQNGKTATKEMRRVHFNLMDRLVLTPLEFYLIMKPLSLFLVAVFLLRVTGIDRGIFGPLWTYVASAFVGAVVVPACLPFVPGKAFAWKGFLAGALLTVGALNIQGPVAWQTVAVQSLLLPVISSYAVMNFTGATTYTSITGVEKEMKIAIPLQIASVALALCIGLVTIVMGYFS